MVLLVDISKDLVVTLFSISVVTKSDIFWMIFNTNVVLSTFSAI